MKIVPLKSQTILTRASCSNFSNLKRKLAAAAPDEELGNGHISKSIDLLRGSGLMLDNGNLDPEATARMLMQVGSANLSVGRLLEGHINALLLIDTYGTSEMNGTVRKQIANGALLGVWGADGEVPVGLHPSEGHLIGVKRFASGIGTVTHAVVTVNSGPDVRLALVDVSDPSRADTSTWDTLGMKATASGTYDFSELSVDNIDWIGAAGDYLKEPYFVGGVWRIAALQAGATAGLLDHAASKLRALGRMDAEPQKARLMTVLTRAWAGMALVERAARAVSDQGMSPEQVVSTSISARLFTEEVGLDAIRAVEQSIGLGHFETGSDTGRMARDLSVYLRQAARDAFLHRAADYALGKDDNIWGVFE